MSIQYSAIARGSKVLCCHEEPSESNYQSLVSSILPNIPVGSNAKTSYTTNSNMNVNVVIDNGLTFLCVSKSEAGKTLPFEFLNEIKSAFLSTSLVHRAMHAGEFEFNREFGHTLTTITERYSLMGNAPNGSNSGMGGKMSTLQSQVDEVKGVMIRNIEAVLERGQRIEDLMAKSTDLEASASSFQKTARKVKRKMWWRNTRMMLTLGLAVVIALIILILIILFSTGVLPIHYTTPTTTTTTTTTTTVARPSTKMG